MERVERPCKLLSGLANQNSMPSRRRVERVERHLKLQLLHGLQRALEFGCLMKRRTYRIDP